MKAQKKTIVPRLVADDNGYADHKIAWFDSDRKILTLKVPSLIEVGSTNSLSDAQGNAVGAYEVGGVRYTCDPTVRNPMNIRNSEYPTSLANRVLVNHALTRAGLLGMPARIAVTLPLRDYYNQDGSVNETLKAATINNFTQGEGKTVTVIGSEAQPEILSVSAYCEALCGYFDWAMDEACNIRDEAMNLQGEIAIVDIGGSTTDILAVQLSDNRLIINNASSGTEKAGVLDAKNALDAKVREHMVKEGVAVSGHDKSLPAWFVNLIMQKGEAKYLSKDWKLADIRDEACGEVAERITSYIRSKLGNLGNYQVIIVIGGGAIVFKQWLEQMLPGAEFMDEFANARGALKYMAAWGSFEDQ
ncbi:MULTISPECIES: ParM/StbA family protein [Ectopseudomonas]|uniref:Plasmid segregation protein ParM n=2 Tax=Ectopseudomonas TaxID=3236654 RepID=A0A1G6PRT5_9GAMM|nr:MULTISPECIES: ParM/StbA family protein [Pseudomonas]ALN21962.1 hypothetical protein DW68_025115 [Pseudomonas mendocina S5.2]KER97987.1 hypothetical protein HN51_24570 [Pseudomonas mendocina]MBP3061882.1 hypothetical protein [Pseudomonas chengduensis]NNB75174.1 ParM/StbA family protein [Pseudomonas chengduensis]SDC82374.1 plasmid segregation protein ParM [Pseudomonas chengduensis]